MWDQLYHQDDRLRDLKVGRNADGRLEVFGLAPDDTIWHTWQVAPSGNWNGGWEQVYKSHCIRVLIKIVVNPTVPIATMLANMRTVFGTADIRIEEGPRENITVVPSPG